MILVALFVLIEMGKVPELKSSSQQSIAGRFGEFLTCRNQRFQDISIFFERMIDISNQVIAGSRLLIIVGIATLIIAKLFIYTAQDRLTTIQTGFDLRAHTQKVMRSI
jgi:hypothetical protein